MFVQGETLTTVVAQHMRHSLMMGKGHVAMWTTGDVAASVALHIWRIASAVLEEDDLITTTQGSLYIQNQVSIEVCLALATLHGA